MGLETFELSSFEEISLALQEKAIDALENGKILFFPKLTFQMKKEEALFLSPDKLSPNSKNISFNIHTGKVGGTSCQGAELEALKQMVQRFSLQSRRLVDQLLPHYFPHLKAGRTSFRPAEVLGRETSYRKDDTRLHVDSFPSTPVKGERILRVFTNVNPEGKMRVWKVGEDFPEVVKRFAPRVASPLPGLAFLLKTLRITKDYRTLYDHYMLKIHDMMKGDTEYQKAVKQEEILFPPGSTWIVFTDQVSHAALSGQHLFEQTFYLPAGDLKNPETSPLRILEKFLNKKVLA